MPSITVLQSGAVGGFFLLFGLLLFAVYVGLIVWTYSDAQRNSPQSAVLWALVVFFAPFLGVLLYVLLGRGQL
ncbi:PLDc N-terminal domain-containing protein [Natronoarchaeum sp. GCM10025703]|uniref:PLDc N-terminal domain-containing protein n=1 Tax=unclassified Natronoarchaeum TaxID=2620183 RepID=UPI00361F3A75